MAKCKHYWNYSHTVYEGRKGREGEVGMVRYCGLCKHTQMAFASRWQKPPKGYDVSIETADA